MPPTFIVAVLFCFCYSPREVPWEKETETEAELSSLL